MGQIWNLNIWIRTVSVHFDSASQNVLKLILKGPIFVPFGANHNLFGCQIWHSWSPLYLWYRNVIFGPKLCESGPEWDKSENFSSSQNVLKSYLNKSRICLFEAIWPYKGSIMRSVFWNHKLQLYWDDQTTETSPPSPSGLSYLGPRLLRLISNGGKSGTF